MIINDKITKLPDGENLTLFALSDKEMVIYHYKNGIKKKLLSLGKIVRCQSLISDFYCEYIKQISMKHLCLCYKGNLSIIENS